MPAAEVQWLEDIDDACADLLFSQPVALATVNEDGSPHVCFVAFVKRIDGRTLLITDNFLGKPVKILSGPAELRWRSATPTGKRKASVIISRDLQSITGVMNSTRLPVRCRRMMGYRARASSLFLSSK